jgi:hypothetical protein
LSREFDGLLPVVRAVGGGELLGAQRVLEALSRKVLAAQAELDAAAAEGGVCAEHGYGSVRAMVADVHRLGPREATAREARREQLASRRSLTGEVLRPLLLVAGVERATGIEPAWPAWKAGALPLSYARAAQLRRQGQPTELDTATAHPSPAGALVA